MWKNPVQTEAVIVFLAFSSHPPRVQPSYHTADGTRMTAVPTAYVGCQTLGEYHCLVQPPCRSR